MPTYEYQCQKCNHVFEVMQSFSDAPITKCVNCQGKVKKLFSPPAIIFKGKGFYCTDNKTKSGPERTYCPIDKSGESACPKAAKCAAERAAS